ncbi:tagaturonate epimerase family protein [Georgenia sp. MJ173]|uniref:tagaturonate epimerase family protein n=1 Tax=Georgenia sunbinii TaxID=3117728 RepID=UPI002F262DB5
MTLRTDALTATIERDAHGRRTLVVTAEDTTRLDAFEGDGGPAGSSVAADGGAAGRDGAPAGGYQLRGPLSAANAAALRTAVDNLRPRPLGTGRSIGTGDRLGLATPGHARAFQEHGHGVTPVFAQQSIREMDRLGRTAQQVLDDATFGCVEAGWSGGVGADADHIKTTEGIDRGLAAGFTTFTLDPGDHVVDPDQVTGDVTSLVPWSDLEADAASLVRRYGGHQVDVDGETVTATEHDLLRAAVKYGAAIAETVRLSRHLRDHARHDVEIEVAIDETDLVTSAVEHYYVAAELERLGVRWVSLAPRYADGFEKGVEYLGQVEALAANLRGHTAVAEQFGGYKISLHSGSDKFSIYPAAVEATKGRIHLKTSGTSYLSALEVAARQAPDLLREIYGVSRESYRKARASYQVSADVDRTPDPASVPDADLPELVTAFDSRQMLHVGYGDVLTAVDGAGQRYFDAALREVLTVNTELYATVLADHLGRHVAPFAVTG